MTGGAPDLRVFADLEALSTAAAENFAGLATDAVAHRGRFTVALSGGSTPRPLFELLAAEPLRSRIDWSHLFVFWSDERCVPPDQPESNYGMAEMALLHHVPVPASQVHRMRGELAVPQQAAQEYAAELRAIFGKAELPRFDLILLGLGEEGHTASLFPGVAVPDDPNTLVAAVFVPKVQMWRLTFTFPVLNAAANVIFLVSGAGKADVLRALVAGPPTLGLPAQRVRPRNGSLTVYADRAAAEFLSRG